MADATDRVAGQTLIEFRFAPRKQFDQPGLVHRIASLLRGAGVNIESMDTHLTSAPITGAPMFEMELIIAIPASTPIGKLRQDVGRMCDEMNIDWRMEGV